MKRPFAVFLFLTGLTFNAVAQQAATSHAESVQQINTVIESFRTAIIKHDGKTLSALFLPEHSNWLEVLADPLFGKVKEKHPEVQKVKQSNFQTFAEFVTTAKEPIEEQFNNIHVDTNGSIAAVYFDFTFLENGKPVNRGSETWQLINTESGWKIGAMLYSSGGVN